MWNDPGIGHGPPVEIIYGVPTSVHIVRNIGAGILLEQDKRTGIQTQILDRGFLSLFVAIYVFGFKPE